MSPKTKFEKEDIIAAAFDLAKENGFSAVTARRVAGVLGSSVAPIYVNFQNIEDLIEAVVARVFLLSNELIEKQSGTSPFENMGKASLEFAKKYPVFFQELMLKPNPYMAAYPEIEKQMLELLSQDQRMAHLSFEQRKDVFLKMRIFQYGLSAMVANGLMPFEDEKEIEKLLIETGEQILQVYQANP